LKPFVQFCAINELLNLKPPSSLSIRSDLPSSTNPAVWPFLGFLRFYLAVVVAANHYDAYNSGGLVHMLGGFGGFNAVLAFLVISGYSIAHSLISSPTHYIWRRFLRIYPLFVLSLAVAVIYPAITLQGQKITEHFLPADVIGQLFMLDGILTPSITGNNPLWTISLEWWCYMLAPLLMRLTDRRLFVLLCVLAAVHLSWIVVGPVLGGFYGRVYGGQKICFLAVFWVLGFWYYRNRLRPAASLVLLGTVWLLTGLNRDNMDRNYQATLCLSCVALAVANQIQMAPMFARLGNLVGNTSYALYLFHIPLFRALRDVAHLNNPVIIICAACICAALIHLLVEVPLCSALRKGRLRYDKRLLVHST
jgi:peptidoglycan/LPS O-acetylase OafA/YrhL